MTGVLRHTLVVRHPETHAAVGLLAGEPVPDWATDLVDDDDLEDGGEKSPPAKKTAAKKSAGK